jgi:hypothetical protein
VMHNSSHGPALDGHFRRHLLPRTLPMIDAWPQLESHIVVAPVAGLVLAFAGWSGWSGKVWM